MIEQGRQGRRTRRSRPSRPRPPTPTGRDARLLRDPDRPARRRTLADRRARPSSSCHKQPQDPVAAPRGAQVLRLGLRRRATPWPRTCDYVPMPDDGRRERQEDLDAEIKDASGKPLCTLAARPQSAAPSAEAARGAVEPAFVLMHGRSPDARSATAGHTDRCACTAPGSVMRRRCVGTRRFAI